MSYNYNYYFLWTVYDGGLTGGGVLAQDTTVLQIRNYPLVRSSEQAVDSGLGNSVFR